MHSTGRWSPLHLFRIRTSLKSYLSPSTARDQSAPIVQNGEKTVHEKPGYRYSGSPLPKVALFIHSAMYMLYRCGIELMGNITCLHFLKLLFQDDVTCRQYSLAKLYSHGSREERNLGLFATQAQVPLLHFAIEMMYK